MTTRAHGFQPAMNRRGMLRLMWGGAAGTAAAGLGVLDMPAAAVAAQAGAGGAAVPPARGIIRTIAGDLDPAVIRRITEENPRRFLTFVPRQA